MRVVVGRKRVKYAYLCLKDEYFWNVRYIAAIECFCKDVQTTIFASFEILKIKDSIYDACKFLNLFAYFVDLNREKSYEQMECKRYAD